MAVSKWNWKIDTDSGQKVQGKNGFTRFLGWLNAMLNPNHAWFDYDKIDNKVESLANRYTDAGVTTGEVERNEMQMQNVEDQYQRQVTGMQKAGINPALMYGSGPTSAPSVNTSGPSTSMSDLMQTLMIPAQLKLMSAQAKNVEANTQKQISETDQIKQVMQFYPRLTEHTIAEITSRTGLNLTNISKEEANIAILEFEKIIKGNEAKYSEEFYKLRNAVQDATTLHQKASALEAYMRACWTEYETEYTKSHDGARPSSSSLLALADAVMSWLGINPSDTGNRLVNVVTDAVSSITSDDAGSPSFTPFYREDVEPWKIKGKTIVEHGKSLWSRAKRALRLR